MLPNPLQIFMREKLRCAVIGVGAIGIEHLNSLLHCPRAATVAIAETHPQRLREAAEKFHIPRAYSNYRELLEQPDIDAVTIALPNYLHAPVAIDALNARKHVLIEKPMATNAKEAAKIVAAAQKNRRIAMVAKNFRFDRHTQSARAAIQRGDLGEIYHARGFSHRNSQIPRIGSWFTQKQFAGGGCMADSGSMLIDALLHLLNDFDVVSVTAATHAKFGNRGRGEGTWGKSEVDPKRPFDVEDHGTALLRMKKGYSVTVDTSWAGFHPGDTREEGIDLLGTEAGMSLFPAKLFKQSLNGFETTHFYNTKNGPVEDRISHFVNCIVEGKKPIIPIEESLKVQQILDAIYASAETGKEVRLNGK
jgi:predicted dehydrogenase